ncbi:MAG: hypothetical protein Q4Q30_06115 [Eggerthella sp.]|nr:hypothetical protein [Eggerthella sp.]
MAPFFQGRVSYCGGATLFCCSGNFLWYVRGSWCCVLVPVLVGVLAAVDFVPLLFTSVYGFSAIVRARNRRLLTSGTAAALIVLHALFVADVIAAIVLYVKIRKATKGTSDGMMEAETA